MPPVVQEQTRQNTAARYLRMERLEARLRELFPDVTDFKIRVFYPPTCSFLYYEADSEQMQNDEYSFIAPRKVEASELVAAQIADDSEED